MTLIHANMKKYNPYHWRYSMKRLMAAFLFLGLTAAISSAQTQYTITGATSGTIQAGYPAANAFDGSTTTRFNSDGSGLATAWIQFNLGSVKTVSEIKLLMYSNGRTYPIRIDIGSSSFTYTAVTPSTGTYWDQTITPTSGQYVKITMTAANGSGNNYLSIYEAQIFGSSGGNVAPTITTQPANVSVVAPATATFSVVATGTPTPTYQWRRNGTNISGATASSYTTGATTVAADNGAKFDVVVTNAAGSVTSAQATLTVTSGNVAPAITTQPSSISVVAPATATFSVVATGTPTPTYQWRRNGTNISGATASSYTTGATTVAADNGAKFDVVVTNAAGSVTSAQVTLTVASASAGWTANGNNLVYTGGSVAIGTTSPGAYMLAVRGRIGAKEVVITQTGWSDFVFKSDYNLKPLEKVAEYIKTNKHLEGIPTEAEVAKGGISLGDMQAKLLQKVEELSLYLIALKKDSDSMMQDNAEVKEKIHSLEMQVRAK
jgi:predicted small secreted protein